MYHASQLMIGGNTMSLGTRLKESRLKKGVSLQVVADAVGASKPHIWELERGSSKNPSLDLIAKLAKYFGVTVDYLAGMNELDDEENSPVKAFARELSSKNLSETDLEFLLSAANTLSEKNRND